VALALAANIIRFPKAAKRAPRGYIPSKGLRLDLLDTLASIAAYQAQVWRPGQERYGAYRPYGDNPAVWCIVRQRKIIAWHLADLKRLGHELAICRRTLAYHLAGLIHAGYIKRETRHIGDGRSKLKLRPSLYTFTNLGRLWIKRTLGRGPNRSRRLAVQNVAQSGSNPEPLSLTSFKSAVDKTVHSVGNENTGTTRGAPSSPGGNAAPRQKTALVRKGAAPGARKRQGARGARSTARRPPPARVAPRAL